jgi:hypothetical protein
VCILGSFAMFAYLAVEGWAGRLPPYLVLPSSAVLGVALGLGAALLLARLGLRMAGSEPVATSR